MGATDDTEFWSGFQEKLQRLGKNGVVINEKNVMSSHGHAAGILGYMQSDYHSLFNKRKEFDLFLVANFSL